VSKWLYPDKEVLQRWVKLLEQPTFVLHRYLPPIDDGWITTVVTTLDLLKFGYYGDEFHHKAAHVLYKICKNHYFIDSNKRSSLIVLYLFCIVNRYTITCSPETVRKLAERTADIHGSKNYENDINDIEASLKNIIVPVSQMSH
jgi:death-on-curing family protein